MKQTIKNIGKALLGLVMPIKHQPLSKEWIEANKKELEKSVKNSAFRPPRFKKFNTTVKNEFKSKDVIIDTTVFNDKMYTVNSEFVVNVSNSTVDKNIDKENLTTEQKLKDALDKLGSQPGYGKWEKSDAEYIKCNGTGTITHRDEIYYYAPSNLHLSKDFIDKVTKEQLERYFDIDNDDEFRGWYLDKLLKVRGF